MICLSLSDRGHIFSTLSLWSRIEVAVITCFVLQLCVANSFHWRPKLSSELLAIIIADSTFLLRLIWDISVCVKGAPRILIFIKPIFFSKLYLYAVWLLPLKYQCFCKARLKRHFASNKEGLNEPERILVSLENISRGIKRNRLGAGSMWIANTESRPDDLQDKC